MFVIRFMQSLCGLIWGLTLALLCFVVGLLTVPYWITAYWIYLEMYRLSNYSSHFAVPIRDIQIIKQWKWLRYVVVFESDIQAKQKYFSDPYINGLDNYCGITKSLPSLWVSTPLFIGLMIISIPIWIVRTIRSYIYGRVFKVYCKLMRKEDDVLLSWLWLKPIARWGFNYSSIRCPKKRLMDLIIQIETMLKESKEQE